jgi:hypothetical protein
MRFQRVPDSSRHEHARAGGPCHGRCVMIMTTMTASVGGDERSERTDDGLREKMLRELELDLSYALGREDVARQGWGMRQASCSARPCDTRTPVICPSP